MVNSFNTSTGEALKVWYRTYNQSVSYLSFAVFATKLYGGMHVYPGVQHLDIIDYQTDTQTAYKFRGDELLVQNRFIAAVDK